MRSCFSSDVDMCRYVDGMICFLKTVNAEEEAAEEGYRGAGAKILSTDIKEVFRHPCHEMIIRVTSL